MTKLAPSIYESVFVVIEATEEDPLPPGVLMRIEGTLGEVEKLNKNGRIYPRKIMAREVRSNRRNMKERGMFSLADHPGFMDSGGGSVFKAAGVVVSAEIADGDHKIEGVIDLFDNHAGNEVAAIVRARAKLGISQRGYGSVDFPDEYIDHEGTKIANAAVVQNDYKLESWDIVIGPSADSYVHGFRETHGDPKMLTLALLISNHASVYAEAKTAIESDLEDGHKTALDKAKTAAHAEGKTEGADAAKVVFETEHNVALTIEAELAARNVEDVATWLETVDGRTATLEAERATEKTRADTEKTRADLAEGQVSQSAALRAMLRDKCAENPALYVKCESVAFNAEGKPAMTAEALGTVIESGFAALAAPPKNAPPQPGNGHIDPEGGNDTTMTDAQIEELASINEMRSRTGMPILDRLPGTPAPA